MVGDAIVGVQMVRVRPYRVMLREDAYSFSISSTDQSGMVQCGTGSLRKLASFDKWTGEEKTA